MEVGRVEEGGSDGVDVAAEERSDEEATGGREGGRETGRQEGKEGGREKKEERSDEEATAHHPPPLPTPLGKDVDVWKRMRDEGGTRRWRSRTGVGTGVGGEYVMEGQNKIVCTPKRFLVVVNPISGSRRGALVWDSVEGLFHAGALSL